MASKTGRNEELRKEIRHVVQAEIAKHGLSRRGDLGDREYAEALGVYIKQVREERGLSVKDLSERAKMSPTMIRELESGRFPNPGILTLKAVAVGLAKLPTELFEFFLGRSDDAPRTPYRRSRRAG